MPSAPASLSVLVVDEDPDILGFFARILDANGMRALLARTPAEAIGIAKRGYVPIDLVITDVALPSDVHLVNDHAARSASSAHMTAGRELVDSLRQLRPDVRVLLMSAHNDAGVIRIEMMERGFSTDSGSLNDKGLIETIQRAATEAMVYRAGSMYTN